MREQKPESTAARLRAIRRAQWLQRRVTDALEALFVAGIILVVVLGVSS